MQSHLTFNFVFQHSILIYSRINCKTFMMPLMNGSQEEKILKAALQRQNFQRSPLQLHSCTTRDKELCLFRKTARIHQLKKREELPNLLEGNLHSNPNLTFFPSKDSFEIVFQLRMASIDKWEVFFSVEIVPSY